MKSDELWKLFFPTSLLTMFGSPFVVYYLVEWISYGEKNWSRADFLMTGIFSIPLGLLCVLAWAVTYVIMVEEEKKQQSETELEKKHRLYNMGRADGFQDGKLLNEEQLKEANQLMETAKFAAGLTAARCQKLEVLIEEIQGALAPYQIDGDGYYNCVSRVNELIEEFNNTPINQEETKDD